MGHILTFTAGKLTLLQVTKSDKKGGALRGYVTNWATPSRFNLLLFYHYYI